MPRQALFIQPAAPRWPALMPMFDRTEVTCRYRILKESGSG
jgi:hypothetical protein